MSTQDEMAEMRVEITLLRDLNSKLIQRNRMMERKLTALLGIAMDMRNRPIDAHNRDIQRYATMVAVTVTGA